MGEMSGKPQKFTYSHLGQNSFEEGLRYASIMISVWSSDGGLVRAHVIKLLPPFDARSEAACDVQFVPYCLKGWMKAIDGQEVVMREGSCWPRPPNIEHTVLGYSDDCELLEIIMPAIRYQGTLTPYGPPLDGKGACHWGEQGIGALSGNLAAEGCSVDIASRSREGLDRSLLASPPWSQA